MNMKDAVEQPESEWLKSALLDAFFYIWSFFIIVAMIAAALYVEYFDCINGCTRWTVKIVWGIG